MSLLVGACGNKLPGPVKLQLGPRITGITYPTAAEYNAGDTFTFSVTTTGPAVVSYLWTFGGGAVPDTSTAANPTVTLVNPSTTADATYTVTVTVTDADNRSDTETAQYSVGPTLNQAPVFVDPAVPATGLGSTFNFTINDADGDDVAITLALTAGEGLGLAPTAIDAGAGNYGPFTVTLTNMSPDDIAYTVTITLDDGVNAAVSGTFSGTAEGFPTEADTIYVFAPSSVNVGDTFQVLCYASEPAQVVGYLNSVEIAYSAGLAPDSNSWNLGAPGGAQWEKDGSFWAASTDSLLEIGGGNFFLGPTVAVNVSPLGTPPNGVPAGTSGPLFNFMMEATAAGEQTLTFVHAGTNYLLPDTTMVYFANEVGATITVN